MKSEVVDDVHAPFDLFGKKTPYRQIFSNVSERILGDIDPRLVCKFGEIWPTGSRQNRALLTRRKKNKI